MSVTLEIVRCLSDLVKLVAETCLNSLPRLWLIFSSSDPASSCDFLSRNTSLTTALFVASEQDCVNDCVNYYAPLDRSGPKSFVLVVAVGAWFKSRVTPPTSSAAILVRMKQHIPVDRVGANEKSEQVDQNIPKHSVPLNVVLLCHFFLHSATTVAL